MLGGRIAALLAALLISAAPTLAAESSISLTSELPITVDGDRRVLADDADALVVGDAGQVALLIDSVEGTLDRIIHRAYGIINHDDPQAGILWEQRVDVVTMPLDNALVTLDERHEDFTLLLHDAAMKFDDGNAATPMHVGILASPQTVQSTAEPPIQLVLGRQDAQPFHHLLQSGLYEARSMDGRITSSHGANLFLANGALHYHSPATTEVIRANFREEIHPGSIFDPVEGRWTGPGEHTEYVHEYIQIRIESGTFQLQHRATPLTMFTSKPLIETTGTAHFPAATGSIEVTDGEKTTTHTFANDDVDVTGRMSFALATQSEGRTRTAVVGDGDVVDVTYNAVSHEYEWAVVAVATGLGAILLGIAAWIGGAGKWLLGSAGTLVAGYARVQGDAVLQHDGRQQVYDLVQAEPGMHFMDLCGRLPFGASTLNYHLRVLERNEFVARVKDGRYVRFFDRRSGAFAGDRKEAVSALRNQTTAAIADCIVQNPGIAQRDLAQAFGIAASTVSWHVDRLQRNDLVTKQRDAHFTRYYMGQGWSHLPSDELARFGIA